MRIQTPPPPQHVARGQRRTADHVNAVIDSIPVIAPSDSRYDPHLVNYDAPFQHQQIAPDKVKIYAGTLRLHSVANIVVSETDVTLTGDPEYIYVQHGRGSGTATIAHSSTDPVSTSTYLYVPLVKFTVVSAAVYTFVCRLHAATDINFDTPLMASP